MTQNKDIGFFEGKYLIADIKTHMILRENSTTEVQARDYLCDFRGKPEIEVGVSDELIEAKRSAFPHLSVSDCEYMWSGEQFFRNILNFDGFVLHASAVVYEGKAYLFSAPSGTGKSTHTKIWQRVFGEDNAFIINDDKPIIRLVCGKVMVYGTPWSGKDGISQNVGVPLQGICFLERAEENRINSIDTKDAIYSILNQTVRPQDVCGMDRLLDVLGRVLKNTKVYRMGCNMSDDAAITAYKGMNDKQEEAFDI